MEEPQSKRSTRGKSFSVDEDVALCKSWLVILQDSMIGNQQPNFWNRILEQYKSNIHSPNERTAISIHSRWQSIMMTLKKFYTCIQQIESKHENETEKIVQAKVMYYELEKKNFVFDHCWAVLKDNVKFQEYIDTKKQKPKVCFTITPLNSISLPSTPLASNLLPSTPLTSTPPSSPSTPSASVSLDSNVDPDNVFIDDLGKRPNGSKTEKEPPRKNQRLDSMLQTITSNSKMMLDLLHTIKESHAEKEQRKAEARAAQLNMLVMINEREQRKEEDKIMLMDTSNMNETQKLYYTHRQAEILALIQARKDGDLSSS